MIPCTFDYCHRGANVTISSVTNDNRAFWRKLDGKRNWEKGTLEIFEKYVTSETIVVDFGAWIGPTLLFHGQFSKASYGIEADPAAFAVVERNVQLNQGKSWGSSVSVHPFCVSTPQDVGQMTMRGAKAPGASMSSLTENLARRDITPSWTVRCYTLPTILDSWGVVLSRQPVMFKIDVESYECKLLPTFYDWLKDESRLPIIYVSFHPNFADCSPEEWAGVLKVFKLYDHVHCHGDNTPMPITKQTTFEEFEKMKKTLKWQRHSSAFVLWNK